MKLAGFSSWRAKCCASRAASHRFLAVTTTKDLILLENVACDRRVHGVARYHDAVAGRETRQREEQSQMREHDVELRADDTYACAISWSV